MRFDRSIKWAMLSLALVLGVPASHANPMTFKEMLFVCEVYGKDFCDGYIVGTFQTLIVEKEICPVTYPKIEEMRRITALYFLTRPDKKLDGGVTSFIQEAAKATYPCHSSYAK
jgi:hypothetical protein